MITEQYSKILEFNKILEMLSEMALTEKGKEKIASLGPYYDESKLLRNIEDTTEARETIEQLGSPPISAMKDIDKYLDTAIAGGMLLPEQLEEIQIFLMGSKRLGKYLEKAYELNINLGFYKDGIFELTSLADSINYSVRSGRILDEASKKLKEIRRKKEQLSNQIKAKLETMLSSKKNCFADNYVSKRNGRYVLPVKKEFKNQISGVVIDESQTGATCFVEPSAVIKLSNEIDVLEIDEMNEENRILYDLSDQVANHEGKMRNNIKTMEDLDFIFAKGKLSIKMKGVKPVYNWEQKIHIEGGRHPLLEEEVCVPLDFYTGKNIKGVIITGPNTGGKTVALKAVGLFSLMAQSGLHVPCKYCAMGIFSGVFCDIGDNQSISENLSTFSAHIRNIVNILEKADSNSLVLLDELGSGTDPLEGMGIAIAILEELRMKECFFIATTHYPEVKHYGDEAENIINASMAFDKESLKPLYRLQIGIAGESCALYIAKKLGLNKRALTRAYQEAYEGENTSTAQTMDNSFLEDAPEAKGKAKAVHTLTRKVEKRPHEEITQYERGDSVFLLPEKKLAIVYQEADEQGNLVVMFRDEKIKVNHKRITLNIKGTELYPPDYDFSIIFETKQGRKDRKTMGKHHVEGLVIKVEE